MRIDSHVHGEAEEFGGDPAGYVEACRQGGVERIVLIEPLDRCLAAVETFGEFIIPVARVEMDDCSSREIAAAIEAGMKGVKFIRPRAPYGDERYWHLYEKIEQLGAVAVFHTGYLGCRGREDHPAHTEYMRATQVEVVARRFSDLKILMAHFSNPWWEEAWKIMRTLPNVYADLSGGTAFHRSLAFWSETFAPNGQIDQRALAKLLFGTDCGYFGGDGPPSSPVTGFYDRLLDRMEVSPEQREAVLLGNAVKLFGLESS